MITTPQREALRRRFRPSRVELMFVGESPPASGRFFYSGNSGLYRAMSEAFQIVDPTLDDENFLAGFQARGCYLTDLSHEPVDHLEIPARRQAREKGEERLALEIARLQPATIAPLLRAIVPHVKKATDRAKWTGPMRQLPYPGRWIRHREEFLKLLVPVIRGLPANPTPRHGTRVGKRSGPLSVR